jgi:hypothetical protein
MRVFKTISQEKSKERLYYDPNIGIFTWIKVAWNKTQWIGKEAGCIDPSNGYVVIKIDGVVYRAHRLAWIYMTGIDPGEQIDHVNLVRNDNRFSNLREASHTQQQQNGPLWSSNTSGHKGVTRVRNKWRAQIGKDNRMIYLGDFSSKEEAAAAYRKAAERLFGDFARPI